MEELTMKLNRTLPLRRHAERFCDDDYGCYREEFFLELLVFERKRSERSGKPFVVMTIDISRIYSQKLRHEITAKIVTSLTQLIRETDIKGWYREGQVIGILFTEMNTQETDILEKKISQMLRATMTPAEKKEIRASFHRFPFEGKAVKPGALSMFTFYPDLPDKVEVKKNALKVKRVMDIAGSICGLLLFSPFFICIPIAIKLTSRGPILFRQERVGQYEKTFKFLKFRSMYVNNNDEVHKKFVQDLIAKKITAQNSTDGTGQTVFKITNDPRITPLGRFLRKTSLDELPQFFNVLKGEMSLAGPRPPIPYELEKYDSWHLRRVLEVKPGITGLWQVMGRSSTTFDEMVRLDLQYAQNWTIWMDIKILFKTPLSMIAGRGAY